MMPINSLPFNWWRKTPALIPVIFFLAFSRALAAQEFIVPGDQSGVLGELSPSGGGWENHLLNPRHNAPPYFVPSLPNGLQERSSPKLGAAVFPRTPIDGEFHWLPERMQSLPLLADNSIEELLKRIGIYGQNSEVIYERLDQTGQIRVEEILRAYPAQYLDPMPFIINAGNVNRCCLGCICGGDPTGPICVPPGCIGNPELWPFVGNQLPKYRLNAIAVEKKDDRNRGSQIIAKPIQVKPRISEFNRLAPKSYFSTVGLQSSDRRVFCSGVLIGKASVLTAAHCLCDNTPSYVFFGNTIFAAREVRPAGELAFSMPVKAEAAFLSGSFCEDYETWRNDGRIGQYPSGDLAILHLEERLPPLMSEYGLPTEPIARLEPAPFVYGVGFGQADGIDTAGEKHRARFKFISRLCTDQDAREHGCHAGEENIITSFEEGAGQDSCFGDSGGPIFIRETADSPVPDGGFGVPPRLVAITSRGLATNPDGFCGRGAINTSLEREEIKRWISKHQ